MSIKTFHIVNKVQSLADCMEIIEPHDALLLIENAVVKANNRLEAETNQLFVLQEDLTARGINQINETWQVVDYTQMVEFTLEYDKNISWL